MFKSVYIFKVLSAILLLCHSLTGYTQIKRSEFKEPAIEFMNLDSTAKGSLYLEITKKPEAVIKETCFKVCTILYRHINEIPNVETIKYTVSDYDGVSAKDGYPPIIDIAFSSSYLESNFNKTEQDSAKMLNEIIGVLSHELTHAYQWDDGGRYSEIGGVIEGIADAVRTMLGYKDYNSKKPGGSYKDAYSTSAFFFVWIERNIHKDFIYELNQSMLANDSVKWTRQQVKLITGTSVDDLWKQYQQNMHLDTIEI